MVTEALRQQRARVQSDDGVARAEDTWALEPALYLVLNVALVLPKECGEVWLLVAQKPINRPG